VQSGHHSIAPSDAPDADTRPLAGRAAAASAATAARIVRSAARAGSWDGSAGAAAQAASLARKLDELADRDATAFKRARGALRSDDPAVAAHLAEAADAPLAICEAGADTAALAEHVAGRSDDSVGPDAVAAAILAAGAVAMAAHLVNVNLGVLPGDARATRAAQLEAAAARSADEARRQT
jgi:formiminotetrahydrofolate cyclodeaminase